MILWNKKKRLWLNQDIPSPRIDAAICDLLIKVQNFSDSCIDISCLQLTEKELETLVVKLLIHLIDTLEGQLLADLLNEIRDYEESFEDSV